MIGGVIVLALIVTALTAMVVVSQQYDLYQGTADKMSQKDTDRFSENLAALYPGLTVATCGSCNLNQYNMSLANNGGVAIQITRIYINTTEYLGANPDQIGCTVNNNGPCVLNPASGLAGLSFSKGDAYINAGEMNHIVRLWLPQSIVLPNVTFTPGNSVWIVTTRGRVFSFQWPFPPAGQGVGGTGTPLNIVTGSMKIAYNGTNNSKTDSCHKETPYPLPAGKAGKYLYLLNPWITKTVLIKTDPTIPPATCTQCLYVTVYTANTLNTTITFSWGYMEILTALSSSNQKEYFLGGDYVGIVWKDTFYSYGIPVAVQPGDDFYLIFRITSMNLGSPLAGKITGSGQSFTGTAVMNNGFSNQAENDNTFRQFTIYLDGLYVRNQGGAGC